MKQTSNTAIVLRCANYREHDRMLTLLSPTRGRLEVMSRGCRRPKSPLLAASEPFALGDYELYEKSGRMTLTNVTLTETFYPLRTDYDRLTVGTYLLNVAEAVAQPGQNAQELFMLLLHTLARLTFTDQPWRPLTAGFLLHLAAADGYMPLLTHCVRCGREMGEGNAWMDIQEGGLCCVDCRAPGQVPVSAAEIRWMRMAIKTGSAGWVDAPEMHAPFRMLRRYVETRLGRTLRIADMLPKDEP